MTYTYKEIVHKFKEFFEAHHFVNRFTSGDFDAALVDKSNILPHVHVQPTSATPAGNLLNWGFRLIISDLHRVEETKQKYIEEVLHNTHQICLDFVSFLQKKDEFFGRNNFSISVNSVEPFWDQLPQNLTGWSIDLTLSAHYDHDVCSPPIGDFTPAPPSDCADATVKNSDGNTLFTVVSGGTQIITLYRLTTSSNPISLDIDSFISGGGGQLLGSSLTEAIAATASDPNLDLIAQDIVDGASDALEDELEALICTPCLDASITDSTSVELFTVASGGTQRIDVVRVDGGVADQPVYILVDGWQSVNRAITGAGLTLENVVQQFSDKGTSEDVYAQDIVDGSSSALQDELEALICPTISVIPDYRRPAKPDASYYTGDLGDQYTSGDFNRLDADRTGRVRVLGADNYTLDANTLNEFGTTARYTFDDGTNAWNGSSFDTTYPVAATDYVIIDHLFHLYIYVANLGSSLDWASSVTAVSALAAGGYSWRLPAPDELDAIIPDRGTSYYSAGNMFRRGVVSGFTETFQWTSRIDEVVSTNNAFRYSGELESARRNRTTTSLMSCYAVANYDP